MIRVILKFAIFLSLLLAHGAGRAAASEGEPSRYFAIEVVDEQTGRGVPMVELQATSGARYYTDSAGLVAFHEPGLMDKRVFFAVSAHGYELPRTALASAASRLRLSPEGSRSSRSSGSISPSGSIAITGQGIYRDTILLGRKAPIAEPLLNAQVTGQDSVLAAVYRDKIVLVLRRYQPAVLCTWQLFDVRGHDRAAREDRPVDRVESEILRRQGWLLPADGPDEGRRSRLALRRCRCARRVWSRENACLLPAKARDWARCWSRALSNTTMRVSDSRRSRPSPSTRRSSPRAIPSG